MPKEKMLRQKSKIFLAANPAYTKTALSIGMSAGAELMQKNPDLAQQVFFNSAGNQQSGQDAKM